MGDNNSQNLRVHIHHHVNAISSARYVKVIVIYWGSESFCMKFQLRIIYMCIDSCINMVVFLGNKTYKNLILLVICYFSKPEPKTLVR